MRTFYLVSYTIHQTVEVEATSGDEAIAEGLRELPYDADVLAAEVLETYPPTQEK